MPYRPEEQIAGPNGLPLPQPTMAAAEPARQVLPLPQPGQAAPAGAGVLADDRDTHAASGADRPGEDAGAATPLAALRELCLAALLPYLITRVGLVLVGLLADYYLLPLHKPSRVLASIRANARFPENLQLMWQRFDSGFYLGIAKSGYDTRHLAHPVASWAFYPLYPLVVSAVSRPLGQGPGSLRLSAILVANAGGLAAAAYLYTLIGSRLFVAPSHKWTKGYSLGVRHAMAGATLAKKDLRECEAMLWFYKQTPSDWVTFPEFLANL